MTSNGISLKRKLPALVKAGLTHINISLDTLDSMKYELITRRRGYEAVMDSLEVARSLKKEGLTTKVNCVVIRGEPLLGWVGVGVGRRDVKLMGLFVFVSEGLNDMEVPAFVELTKDMDITVRFIEYMPFEGMLFQSSSSKAH